jgi:dephospho-CoA kinase
LEVNASNGQMVREDLRSKQGMDICAKLSLPSIKAAMISGNIVVIDGLYSFSEYKTLRKEFHDKLVVVAIFCPRKLRYARLEIRKERPLTIFEAEMRDYAEIERIEKGGPIAMADYVIINDTTFEHFFHSIDQFFDKHLSELLSECSED